MGDYVWFADLYEEKVLLYVDGNEYYLNICNCCSVARKGDFFYFLCFNEVLIYKLNVFIGKFSTVDMYSNNIIVGDKIYISGEETGCISLYDFNGNLELTMKIGEHIADFCVLDGNIYAITYNDNFLVKTDLSNNYKKIIFLNTPQRIIVNNKIYVILNDEYFTTIKMLDVDFNELKKITFKRQLYDLVYFNKKIILYGEEFTCVLNENLNILWQKNSTGESLCRFGNIPVLKNTKNFFDITNNVKYPL